MNNQSLFLGIALAMIPASAAAAGSAVPSLYPEHAASVDCLPEIRLTFPGVEDENVVLDEEMPVTITEGTTSHSCTIYGWGAHRFIVFDDGIDITDGGTWTITIPEGTFSVEGEASAPVEAVYTVVGK